jgi:hypothetical protein
VFARPAAGVRSVSFWVDSPGRTAAPHVERTADYDLVATAADGTAAPMPVTGAPGSRHTVTVQYTTSSGATFLQSGTFTVGVVVPDRSVFPGPSTTGPTTTTLSKSGPLVVTTRGAVVENLEVTGSITVRADDVTIRNVVVHNTSTYAVKNYGSRLLLEDTELDGGRRGGTVISGGNWTGLRLDVHDAIEGPRMGSNTDLEHSWVHDLYRCPAGASCEPGHVDAAQTTGGTNVTLVDNYLEAYNDSTRDPLNAALMIGEETAPVRNMTVTGNLFNGGNFSVNASGGGTTGAQAVFRDNWFQGSWRYAAAGNFGPGIDFDASNRLLTGQSVVPAVQVNK